MFKNVFPDKVEQLIKNGQKINIIDVREDSEVAQGMIQGAIHIPLGQLPDRISELDKNKEYAIVCRSGGRSLNACMYLDNMGFSVQNIVGGMLSWKGNTIK